MSAAAAAPKGALRPARRVRAQREGAPVMSGALVGELRRLNDAARSAPSVWLPKAEPHPAGTWVGVACGVLLAVAGLREWLWLGWLASAAPLPACCFTGSCCGAIRAGKSISPPAPLRAGLPAATPCASTGPAGPSALAPGDRRRRSPSTCATPTWAAWRGCTTPRPRRHARAAAAQRARRHAGHPAGDRAQRPASVAAARKELHTVPDILQRIVAVKREEIAAAKRQRSAAAVRAEAAARRDVRPFEASLRARLAGGAAAVIAEVKKPAPARACCATPSTRRPSVPATHATVPRR